MVRESRDSSNAMDTAPTYVAPRTCRVIDQEGESKPNGKNSVTPLADYADVAAYVLIAEPGAGKTTAFRTEAAKEGAVYVTVRRFLARDPRPEWRDTTLFLDGLDESRAGAEDGRTPLDELGMRLDRLGCPRFRLSCRWADWLAANDKEALSDVSPDGTVVAVRLDPLSKAAIKAILAKNHCVDVRNLRREASWNPWCSRSQSKVAGIGGIVSPNLEGTFREILTDRERSQEHQPYVMLLLQMLADGEPLPALSGLLEETVRDPTWNQGVRCWALDALVSYCKRGRLEFSALEAMMHEIEEGSIDDPHDELLGILLKALYPNVLSIAEVQQYLRKPKLVTQTGAYANFWTEHVPRESTPEQLADLLDGIVNRFSDYRPFMVGDTGLYTRLGRLPVEALTRVLKATQGRRGSVAVDRLYEWLGVVSEAGLRLRSGTRP